MELGRQLASLLATLESPTPSLTIFELTRDVRLVGPMVDGVAALLVISGTMYLTDIDMEPVKPGHVVLLPPGRRASIAASPGSPDQTMDGAATLTRRDNWLIADAARGAPPSLVVAGTRIAGSGGNSLDAPVVASIAGCRIGQPIFAVLQAELARGRQGHPALAMSLMAACVVQALRRALKAAPSAPADGEIASGTLIGRAVAAVRARPGDNHTLDSLAGAAGMSRSTFIRHFRRVMRTSPVEYLQRIRLEEARAMLRTTSLPVKTVAAHTGFVNRSHFSRLFRATFGEDPTSYRRVAAPADVG